jgi:M6 family metalloprotease-like protein
VVRRSGWLGFAAMAASVFCMAGVSRARAQSGAADIVRRGLIHGGARPAQGFYEMVARDPHAFEFRHGWLERARAVRQNRQELRSRGAFNLLNAPAPSASPMAATAVSGTLRYPTFMPFFSNTSSSDSAIMDSAAVVNQFWGTVVAPPYSITTYYKEISVNRLTVTGSVIGRGIRVSKLDTDYAGSGSCQGLCPASGVPNLIAELILHADSTVDFSKYVDTLTGYVPAIVILDPQVGAECYVIYPPAAKSIWAHRFSYSGWTGSPITTNDPWPGHPGQFVKIDDYIIQGGQGGPTQCTPGQLAPIGTVTHETGHLFGLPDLYDTNGLTEGLGRWDLMSAGNERLPYRPAHMSAWSLSFLGWISEVPVTTARTITTGPIETSDTAFIVPISGTPDHEFFLLENRQRIGSDSMMYGPGLMIYHADTVLMNQRLGNNDVNGIIPHALAVVEADGNNNLNCAYPSSCNNRGDAGDPFPGTTSNTSFGFGTNPAAVKNSGSPAAVTIDSIQQVAPFGAMRFRVRLGFQVLYAIAGTGTVGATRTIDPANGTFLAEGDSVTLTAVPGTGQAFAGWTGDTAAATAALSLKMTQRFSVTANFVAVADVEKQLLSGTSALTPAQLLILDQMGNNNGRFDLGDFVAWLDRNPGAVSAAQVSRILREVRP